MQKLIQAWTRAGNAVAAYFEIRVRLGPGVAIAEPDPTIPPPPASAVAAAEVAEKRTRVRKAKPEEARDPEVPAPAPAVAANPNDDILGPSVVAKPAAPVEMTEDESAKAVTARGKTLMQRFDKIPAGQVAGQEKPEGYFIAKKILADDFKVARIADMVHAQRLQFIVKVDAILAERK